MNEVLKEMLMFIASYVAIIVIGFFVINWQTKGYLGTFIKVKMSRGKLILGRIKSFTDTYYIALRIEDGFLKGKTRSKENKVIPFPASQLSEFVGVEMGVSVVYLSEDFTKLYNTIQEKTIQMVNVDPTGTEALINRIKNRPRLNEDKYDVLILIGVFLIICIVGFIAFKQNQMLELITALQSLAGNV